MSATPPPDRYWLLKGELPTGPFDASEIREGLASGRIAWQEMACPVGAASWRPLWEILGMAPAPPEPLADATPGRPVAATRPRRRLLKALGTMFAVGLLASAAYGLYEAVRPLRATEVCDRFMEAKTPAEAKKYATPRFHPLVELLFSGRTTDDPNDSFDWTHEIDGPRAGTKLVGFRGSVFIPEAGKRVQMEGHLVAVKSEGWKVDDLVFTGVEGVSLAGPLSMWEEHLRDIESEKRAAAAPVESPEAARPPTPAADPPPVRAADVPPARAASVPIGGKPSASGGIAPYKPVTSNPVTPRNSDQKITPPAVRPTNALGTASGLSVKPPAGAAAKPTNIFGWTEPSDKTLKAIALFGSLGLLGWLGKVRK